MNVNDKLKKVREHMIVLGLEAYIVPSYDAHQSEYVHDHWKSRAWLSGFTGSAGTLVITLKESGLWTDGRYFIQAENELKGSEIKLFKMREPGVPSYTEWLRDNLTDNCKIGFDGKVMPISDIEDLKNTLNNYTINLEGSYDLVDLIWDNRPSLPLDKIFIHPKEFAGKDINEKLSLIRKEMSDLKADYYLLTTLDDIAWLFNIRGNDVKNNPVVISYSLISKNEVYLFIDKEKLTTDALEELTYFHVKIEDYNSIYNSITKITSNNSILVDTAKTSFNLYNSIPCHCKIIKGQNLVQNIKAIKNAIEIEHIKNCHIKDGVAMVKFLYWLKSNIGKETITEISASNKLEAFRNEQLHFITPSFDTIAAYKDHAAMMHYKATKDNQYTLENKGLFLVDSGGQYLDGTTDITRTIVLGEITPEEKHHFTLVLKGHIALSKAKFLHGITGTNLDVLARLPIWNEGIDYKCGTGHGVGYCLSVHEAPQRFSINYNEAVLEQGMIITNEPGIYVEGKHGIRTENELLIIQDEVTDFGTFMRFETITYCPIDLQGVDVTILTPEEKQWLNDYHKKVYALLCPHLSTDEKLWLKEATSEI
ncbi:MAG: aminopeptidase P family protein [Clostridiaceae bacterium]